MTETPADIPPPRPLARHARLEVDHFCADCGYNLHSQTVTRDERLGIMIVRCPECGRFHPAGAGTSAASTWLNRLGVVGLAIWVMLCVALLLAGLMILGGMQMAVVEQATTWAYFAPDGREIEHQYDANSGVTGWAYVDTGQQVENQNISPNGRQIFRKDARIWWGDFEHLLMHTFTLVVALSIGVLIAIACWHMRWRSYVLTAIVPLLGTAFAWLIWTSNNGKRMEIDNDWALRHMLMYVVFQIGLTCLGTFMGRPIARVLVRLFVPPKPRQLLAFLWETDGKVVPK